MNTRQVMLFSVLSNVLTLAVVFALLSGSGAVLAQRSEPPQPAAVGSHAADVAPATAGAQDPASPAALEPNYDVATSLGKSEEGETPEAGVNYIHVAGSTFVPLWSDANVVYDGRGCMHPTGSFGHSVLNFPVVVPDGSMITQIRFYWIDTSGTEDGLLSLLEVDDGIGQTYLAQATTSGSASGVHVTTITGLSIEPDNYFYNYLLLWVAGETNGSIQLCAARVQYTPPIGMIQLLPSTLYNAHP